MSFAFHLLPLLAGEAVPLQDTYMLYTGMYWSSCELSPSLTGLQTVGSNLLLDPLNCTFAYPPKFKITLLYKFV